MYSHTPKYIFIPSVENINLSLLCETQNNFSEFHNMCYYLNCIRLIFIYVSLGPCCICELKIHIFQRHQFFCMPSGCLKKKKDCFICHSFFFDGWKRQYLFYPLIITSLQSNKKKKSSYCTCKGHPKITCLSKLYRILWVHC